MMDERADFLESKISSDPQPESITMQEQPERVIHGHTRIRHTNKGNKHKHTLDRSEDETISSSSVKPRNDITLLRSTKRKCNIVPQAVTAASENYAKGGPNKGFIFTSPKKEFKEGLQKPAVQSEALQQDITDGHEVNAASSVSRQRKTESKNDLLEPSMNPSRPEYLDDNERLVKLHTQQNKFEVEIRNIMLDDNDFTENHFYTKLTSKLAEIREEADQLRRKIVKNCMLNKRKPRKENDPQFQAKEEESSYESSPKKRKIHLKEEKALGSSSFTDDQGTWQCAGCGVINDVASLICHVCSVASEPAHALIDITPSNEENWNCEFCTFINEAEIKICSMCSKTRTHLIIEATTEQTSESEKATLETDEFETEVIKRSEIVFTDTTGSKTSRNEGCACECSTFIKTCKTCGKEPKHMTREELMPLGHFQTAIIEDVLANNEGSVEDIHKILIRRHLEPVLGVLWDYQNIDEETAEGKYSDITDANVLEALADKGLDKERRMRIALAEGQLDYSVNAEAAIALIDDPDLLGEVEDLTIQQILDVAKEGYGDVEECKKRLVQDCQICFSLYVRDQLHELTFCGCRVCTKCFCHTFQTAITDKNVLEWTCQICWKPDLRNPEEREAHFQFLDIKLQQFLGKECHALFTEKLANWNMQQREDFVWCANDKCNNGFQREGFRKTQCPSCKEFMCWQCKQPWVEAHTNRTCEELKEWRQNEEHVADIKDNLKQDGIMCPHCKFLFDLARGGCMHFTCTMCKFQFCCGCYREHKHTEDKGLYCDHPRDCLYYLRDYDVDWLEDLLKMHHIPYNVEDRLEEGTSGMCPINELKEVEDDSKFKDDPCGRPFHAAGLCETHFKEHLVKTINKHRLDPVDKYNLDEVKICLNRSKVQYDENVTENQLQEMRDRIRQELPLAEVPY